MHLEGFMVIESCTYTVRYTPPVILLEPWVLVSTAHD